MTILHALRRARTARLARVPARSRVARLAAVLAVVVLVAGACDDGDEESQATSTTGAAESTTTTGHDATECESAGDTKSKKADAEGGLFFLEEVVAAPLAGGPECGATVEFRFEAGEDGAVGYEIAYAEGPFADTSGRIVTVEGDAFLRVIFLNGTGVDLSGGTPRETLRSEPEVPDGLTAVTDLVEITDFEGSAEWVVGLTGEYPFVVSDGDGEGGDQRSVTIEIAAA